MGYRHDDKSNESRTCDVILHLIRQIIRQTQLGEMRLNKGTFSRE